MFRIFLKSIAEFSSFLLLDMPFDDLLIVPEIFSSSDMCDEASEKKKVMAHLRHDLALQRLSCVFLNAETSIRIAGHKSVMARIFKRLKTCQQEFKIQVSELRDHVQILPQDFFTKDLLVVRALEEALTSKGWFPLRDGSYVCMLPHDLKTFDQLAAQRTQRESDQCVPQFLVTRKESEPQDLLQIKFNATSISNNSINVSFSKMGIMAFQIPGLKGTSMDHQKVLLQELRESSCIIIPELRTVYIHRVMVTDDNEPEIRRQWLLMYGYQLPHFIPFFLEVSSSAEADDVIVVPSCCVWIGFRGLTLSSSAASQLWSQEAIVNKVLQDLTNNEFKFWGGHDLIFTTSSEVDCLKVENCNRLQAGSSRAASLQVSHESKPAPCSWSKATEMTCGEGVNQNSSSCLVNTADTSKPHCSLERQGAQTHDSAEDEEELIRLHDERVRGIKRRAAEERAEWNKLQPLLEALKDNKLCEKTLCTTRLAIGTSTESSRGGLKRPPLIKPKLGMTSALISKNVAKQVSAKSMVVSPANASVIRRDGLLVTCHPPQSVKTAVEQRKKPASSTIKARKRPEQDGQAAQLVKQPMHLSTIASHVLDLTASDEMMPEARDIVFRKQHESAAYSEIHQPCCTKALMDHQPSKLHVRARESLDDVMPLSAMTASNNERKRTKASDLDCNTVISKVLSKHAVGNLKDLNVPEMQCFLRARKQPVGGKKAELEERIISLLKV